MPLAPLNSQNSIYFMWCLSVSFAGLWTHNLTDCISTTVSKSKVGWKYSLSKKVYCGLPWWLSGKESACHCGRNGFDLWPRKSPQLNPCAKTTEPAFPRAYVLQRETTAEGSPYTTTRKETPFTPSRENLHTATETQNSQK